MDDKWFKTQQKRAGKTADEIAAVLGRDRSVVSRIYSGRQRMSLDWAKAFAEVLDVPLATVLEKAGVADAPMALQLAPGFADSDAAPFAFGAALPDAARLRAIAAAMGERPGVDVWRVRGHSMQLAGLVAGDFILVDTHAADRARAGDVVIAQIYNPRGAVTVLRRLEPPVLVAASADPGETKVHVVDGENVVIRGRVAASWRV